MKVVQVLVDNSTAILGLITAAIGLATAFGLDLSKDQVAAIMTFAGALIAVLAALLTIAKRQVVAKVGVDGVIRAGQASTVTTGQRTTVQRTEAGLLVPQAPVSPELLNKAA